MNYFKKKWNPKFRDCISIDWHLASSKLVNFMDSKQFLNYPFDYRLNISKIYLKIKDYERSNNIDEYLNLLDQNRPLIKGDQK